MKKFFFKHHKAAETVVHIISVIFIIAGTWLSLSLDNGDVATPASVFALLLGILMALAVEAVAYLLPPFKYVTQTLQKLRKLSYGRKYFSLPEGKSRSEMCDFISQNLERKKMERKISEAYQGFVGRWCAMKSEIMSDSKNSEYSKFSENYYLYSLSTLNREVFDGIKEDLTERLGRDRAEQKDPKGRVGIVNTICVLADSVEADVAEEASKTMSFKISETLTLSGIRVCVGAVSENKFYLSAEREEGDGSRTNRSLDLLARVTFGVSARKLSSLGAEYTDEYTSLIEKANSYKLSDFIKEEKERLAKEKEKEDKIYESSPTANMSEGEIKRKGDLIFCVDNGVEITAWIMMPEDAMKSFEEEDEDYGDLEDFAGELDGDEDSGEMDEEAEPTVPEDYRGPIVLDASGFGMKNKKIKLVFKKQRDRVLAKAKDYLISQGFETVYIYNEKKKTLDL